MADLILERMADADRAEYERLRANGYALLSQAHEIYMRAVNSKGENDAAQDR